MSSSSDNAVKKSDQIRTINGDMASQPNEAELKNGEPMKKGSPVQILKPSDGMQDFTIDTSKIKEIFTHPDVANTPVAIYSIAGTLREGKSFLLNLFLRYLKFNKKEQWLDSKEDVLEDGFAWRGGTRQHTEGIWIWDKPFFIQSKNEKVALFLMDTQGLYSASCSVKMCSVLFALSNLISSKQIFNVSKQLQEDNLQNLQLFVEYAKVVKKPHRKSAKPFQELLFLIRDWPDPSYKYDFEGGDTMLQEVLQAECKFDEDGSVCENLFQNYEQVTCCLMPFPGEVVAIRSEKQENDLHIGDINDQFLQTVDIVVKNLFEPQKIVLKKHGDKNVTGKKLFGLFKKYHKDFEDLPEITVFCLSLKKIDIFKSLEKCTKIYRKEMVKTFSNKHKKETDIRKILDKCKARVLAYLNKHKSPWFSDRCSVLEFQKDIENNIMKEFKLFEDMNKENQNSKAEGSVKILAEADAESKVVAGVEKHHEDMGDDIGKQESFFQQEQLCIEDDIDNPLKLHTEKPNHQESGAGNESFLSKELICRKQQNQIHRPKSLKIEKSRLSEKACQQGSDKPTYKYVKKIEEYVGKDGGILKVGGCSVDIPKNVLQSTKNIKLTASYGMYNSNKIELAPILECEPEGLQFKKPVTISLQTCYTSEKTIHLQVSNNLSASSPSGMPWSRKDLLLTSDHFITFQVDCITKFKIELANENDLHHLNRNKRCVFYVPKFNCSPNEQLFCVFGDNMDILHGGVFQDFVFLNEENFNMRSAQDPIKLTVSNQEKTVTQTKQLFHLERAFLQYQFSSGKPFEVQYLLHCSTNKELAKGRFMLSGATQQPSEQAHQKISGNSAYEYVEKQEQLVGKEGGMIVVGGCSVDIPKDALESVKNIKLTASYGLYNSNKIELTPLLKCEPEGLQFKKPVTISLQTCYSSQKSTPLQVKWSSSTQSWKNLETENVPVSLGNDGFITFKVDHFSGFKAEYLLTKNQKQVPDRNVEFSVFPLQQLLLHNASNIGTEIGSLSEMNFPTSAIKVIGPSGGKIELNGCSLTVPPNALLTDTNITLTPFTNAVTQIAPNLLCGPAGLLFHKEVTISLPLHRHENVPLLIQYRNTGSEWKPLPGEPKITGQASNSTLTFTTNHFTEFRVDPQDELDSQSWDHRKVCIFCVPKVEHPSYVHLSCVFGKDMAILRDGQVFKDRRLLHEENFSMRNENDPIKLTVAHYETSETEEKEIFDVQRAWLQYQLSGDKPIKVKYSLCCSQNTEMANGKFFVYSVPDANSYIDPHLAQMLEITQRIPNDLWNEFVRRVLGVDAMIVENSITDNRDSILAHRQMLLLCWSERDGNNVVELQICVERYWELRQQEQSSYSQAL